jgi:hypothetical protein
LLQLCLRRLIDVRYREARRDQQRIVYEQCLLDAKRKLQALPADRADETAPHIRKHIAVDDAKAIESICGIGWCDGNRLGRGKNGRDG